MSAGIPLSVYASEPQVAVRVVAEGLASDSVGSRPDWYAGMLAQYPSNKIGFSDGLLAVERDGRMGFINRTGNIVTPYYSR